MPTTAVFDSATLSDAVTKAARVAPSKGAAFDKAAGLHVTVAVAQRSITIRSTDLDVFYTQRVEMTEASGDDVVWRMPSQILADFMTGVPKGDGATTTFIDRGDGRIRMKAGRTTAAFVLLPPTEYPEFGDFTGHALSKAQALAGRIEQVSWACDRKSQMLSGVHIDGNRLIGLNNAGVAVVPCEVPVEEPITVSLTTLAPLLRNASDVRLTAHDNRFFVALDDETEAFTNLIMGDFPSVDQVLRKNLEGEFTAHKMGFLETLDSLLVLIRTDRLPRMSMELSTQGMVPMLTFDLEVPGVGRMQSQLDVQTDWDADEPFKLTFIPSILKNAVSHAKGDTVSFGFGNSTKPDMGWRSSLKIFDKTGYECYIMPLKDAATS